MFDDRAYLVRTKKKGIDVRADEVLDNPDSKLSTLFAKGEAIKRNILKRSYIEASLFCEPDIAKIAKMLEQDIEFLQFYHDFFFDMIGVDRLTKIEHIEDVKDINERQMKLWALGQGISFIEWRLGYKVTISPVEGLVDLFSTCMYKSKEAIYTSSTSDTSKEAVKWSKMSTDIARLLKLWTADNSSARNELALAIREIVPEFGGLDALLEENDKLDE